MARLRDVFRFVVVFGVIALASCPATAGDPVLFTKGVMADVKPDDAPSTGREVKRIDLVACPGEFEPFSLAIRGTADGNWKFVVSDLRSEGNGKVIPAAAVELSMVWWQQTLGHLRRYTRVTDWVLDPGARGAALEKDRTAWVWLTMHVPAGAEAGRYEGTFTLKGEGEAAVTVPLTVEVLPVRLAPAPGVEFRVLQTVAFGQHHNPRTRAQRRPAALALYRELKDHGMTGIAVKCSDWPYKPRQFDGLEACIDAAREVGLNGPVLWYMSSLVNGVKGGRQYAQYDGKCDNWNEARDLANLKDIVREIRKRRKAKAWPEVIFYTVDEPGTQTDDRRIRALRLGTILPKTLKVVHDLGGRGATTMSEPVDDKHNRRWVKEGDELRKQWDLSRPYCHIRIYAYGYPQGKTSLEHEKADCEKRGHEMWFYHNPAIMGRDRCCARLFFGLWGWKVGARGLSAWTYPGGRSVQFELVREGIDDFKYLTTLERLIREKRGSESDRTKAQDFLTDLRAAITLDANGYVTDWTATARRATNPGTSATDGRPPDFASLKRRLAALITPLAP